MKTIVKNYRDSSGLFNLIEDLMQLGKSASFIADSNFPKSDMCYSIKKVIEIFEHCFLGNHKDNLIIYIRARGCEDGDYKYIKERSRLGTPLFYCHIYFVNNEIELRYRNCVNL